MRLQTKHPEAVVALALRISLATARSSKRRRAAWEAYPVDSGSPRCSVLSGGNRAAAGFVSMAAARSLAQFQKAFSDEASCSTFMFKRRWPDGFVCPACSRGRFAALKSRPRLYECLECGRQTLDHRRHGDASIQIAADDVVLGGPAIREIVQAAT